VEVVFVAGAWRIDDALVSGFVVAGGKCSAGLVGALVDETAETCLDLVCDAVVEDEAAVDVVDRVLIVVGSRLGDAFLASLRFRP
jgi:hypothetical protein